VSVINPLAREISAKIVYYGPGLSGKTTSLSHVHATLKPTHRGELISLATEGDRTLYFDFLPVQLGKVRDLDVRLQLYTVPGQVFYGATRRLVLEGADGVIFVADSQRDAQERNIESLNDLEENLREFGRSVDEIPFVIQYNKQDLPNCEPISELRRTLNPHGVPDFPSVASTGEGVTEALKTVTKLVKESLVKAAQRLDGDDGSWRRSLTSLTVGPSGEDSDPPENLKTKIQSALLQIASDSPNPVSSGKLGGPVPKAPDLNDLGDSAPPPHERTFDPQLVRASRSAAAARSFSAHSPPSLRSEGGAARKQQISEPVEEYNSVRAHNRQTIQAPAATPLSFAALWDDPTLVQTIEEHIAGGDFAQAVYRATGAVSGILDHLLGPHAAEGSATRAQLLGLDGHEYLELRSLGSRPASTLTQRDALFALYVLIAAHIKQSRLSH
jgi:signal recognition particle receptor subunit beta